MEHVKFPTGFGERLAEERERLGFSIAVLARLTGIHRNTQARYENEETYPTPIYLSVIRSLGVDVEYLLLGLRNVQTSKDFSPSLNQAKVAQLVENLELQLEQAGAQLIALKRYVNSAKSNK